jgi:large subunit ribosomal protein L4
MQLQVQQGGEPVEVAERVMGADFNEALVHQVVTSYMTAARAGTKAQKTRAEVRGGGRKPWRQKGTGRARAGTIRSPLWRTGGVIFAARPHKYRVKVNRKMYRGAMRSILSELLRQERLLVVRDLTLAEGRTKELLAVLEGLGVEQGVLVIRGTDEKLVRAAGNIPKIDVIERCAVNPVALVGAEQVAIAADALKRIEEGLA